jgi:hypothetical protein
METDASDVMAYAWAKSVRVVPVAMDSAPSWAGGRVWRWAFHEPSPPSKQLRLQFSKRLPLRMQPVHLSWTADGGVCRHINHLINNPHALRRYVCVRGRDRVFMFS